MKRKLTSLARALRKNMTKAEMKLWNRLRRKQLGVIFRRQYPIGDYIADFVSFDAKVVVEVDGGQHADSKTDASRDKWFVSRGFKVLRFWNNDVLKNIEAVIGRVYREVSPPPTPLHRGGGNTKGIHQRNPEYPVHQGGGNTKATHKCNPEYLIHQDVGSVKGSYQRNSKYAVHGRGGEVMFEATQGKDSLKRSVPDA